MQHKPLATSFISKGFAFEIVKREKDVAIFKMSKGKFSCYEVIIVKRHNGYSLGGRFVEPAETYPCSSSWGDLGFTYRELDKAEQKFQELLNRIYGQNS